MGLLDGKAAIVTGSARGIGRATAELFASEGAKVLINDLDADVAEQTAGEIDGETAVFSGDLTKSGAADELVAAAVDAFGAVDICVNNAGYTWDGVAHRMTDEQFQAMIDIHTVVPFRVARALAPHWREAAKAERGEEKEVFRKLINVSSTSGTMGNAGQVNYSAAKMGVVGLTKTLAKEWGQFKINVNAVAFGFVDTRLTAAKEEGGEMTAPSGEKIELGIPEQMRAMASAIIPIGRPATPAGGLRPGAVPRLAAGQLHPRPDDQRDRRHVRGDVHLSDAAHTEGRSKVLYLDIGDRVWPLTRRFMGVHTHLYRLTGGRLGHTIPGVGGKMLLLDHVGAKSGTRRTSPLLYVRDGDDLVVVASKGGFPKHPAWYHNLMANSDTTVQVGTEKRPVHARTASRRGARAPLAARRQAATTATPTTRPAARAAKSRSSSSSRASTRRPLCTSWRCDKRAASYFGRRSSATGVPASSAIASGGQGPAQLSRPPSIVIVVPEKKSPAGEAR